MRSLKLAALGSVSLMATVVAAPAWAQSVPTGNPGTPVQGGERTDPSAPSAAQQPDGAPDTATDVATADAPQAAPAGGDIVVTGVRASLEKALQIKRNSVQVVESVVAEDVGKLPDNNVVSALQRVSGVQVTDRSGGEANTISIRGLPDVLTTLNGRVIFTTDARQFALADIPATLISRIDVYKTRAADQIETGLAGQIDVFTHRPFDFKEGLTASAYVRGIYNEQADTVSPYLSGLISDRWSTGIGDIGLSVTGSFSRNLYRDQSVTPGALVPFATATNPPAGWQPLERIQPTDPRAPGQQIWQAGLPTGLPSAAGSTFLINGVQSPYLLSRDAIFQADTRGDRQRPAVNAALQWAPNSSSTYTFEFFYDGYRNTTFNDLLFTFVDYQGPPGSNSNVVTYDNSNIVKSRHTFFPFNFTSGDTTKAKTDSFVYALNGKWDVGDRLKLSGDLSYQNSKFNSQFVALRTNRVPAGVDVDFNANDGLPAYSFDNNSLLNDPTQWNVGEFYDNANRSEGSAYTFQGDGDYTPDSTFFKKLSFGVRFDDRRAKDFVRTQSAGTLDQPLTNLGPLYYYQDTDFAQGRVDVPSSWLAINGYALADNIGAVRQIFHNDPRYAGQIATGTDLPLNQTLDVREITKSAYLQGDFALDIFGRPLQIEGGVRFTDVITPITTTSQYADATGVHPSVSGRQHTSAFLPSATLRYDITDNLKLRFNFGKTLRRPNFADLDPNLNLTNDLSHVGYGTGSGGNPNLRATKATNYDLTAEWYFARGSGIYGTGFIRKIDGLVVTLNNFRTLTDSPYPNTNSFVISQPVNASNGTLKGIELGAVLFPDNLPSVLKGFGVQGSFTLLDSSQNIPIPNAQGQVVGQRTSSFFGVSDFSYNVTGAYERGPVGLRLSYVYRKAFLNANEAALFANPIGIWRRPEKSLDFQATLQATRQFALTFDAVNLTKELSQQYYYFDGNGGPSQDNQSNALLARTFALGLRYSFK